MQCRFFSGTACALLTVLPLLLGLVFFLILVLLLVLLILVAMFHVFFSSIQNCFLGSENSMPGHDLFIPGTEDQPGQTTEDHGSSDAAGSRSEATGENAQSSCFVDGLPHATGQCIAETG